MEIITLNSQNIQQEHICCAISNNKDIQVSSKKEWLTQRFDDGLVFKKLDARGKCFIEYIPAENAWVPIDAPGYMFINCFWVSGQLKGKGYSSLLLDECVKDSKAKGKKGLVIISSKKKMPFLSDPKFLSYKGFQTADFAQPFYELCYLPFHNDASVPKFKNQVKEPKIKEQGFVLFYSNQCPFTAKYVPVIETLAKEKGIVFNSIKLESKEEAQNAPCLSTSYSLFYNGNFITNEILSEKKFQKLVETLQ